MNTATIPVSGMTCAACSARVQRTLQKTPGVAAANVNLMTGSATVDFDPGATTPDHLVEAIRATGYGAELPGEDESADALLETQDELRAGEISELRRKFAVSIVAAVLAMLFSLPLAGVAP
jgi:P-type Cu+ transporter